MNDLPFVPDDNPAMVVCICDFLTLLTAVDMYRCYRVGSHSWQYSLQGGAISSFLNETARKISLVFETPLYFTTNEMVHFYLGFLQLPESSGQYMRLPYPAEVSELRRVLVTQKLAQEVATPPDIHQQVIHESKWMVTSSVFNRYIESVLPRDLPRNLFSIGFPISRGSLPLPVRGVTCKNSPVEEKRRITDPETKITPLECIKEVRVLPYTFVFEIKEKGVICLVGETRLKADNVWLKKILAEERDMNANPFIEKQTIPVFDMYHPLRYKEAIEELEQLGYNGKCELYTSNPWFSARFDFDFQEVLKTIKQWEAFRDGRLLFTELKTDHRDGKRNALRAFCSSYSLTRCIENPFFTFEEVVDISLLSLKEEGAAVKKLRCVPETTVPGWGRWVLKDQAGRIMAVTKQMRRSAGRFPVRYTQLMRWQIVEDTEFLEMPNPEIIRKYADSEMIPRPKAD